MISTVAAQLDRFSPRSVDRVWLIIVLILIVLAGLAPAQLPASIAFALRALASTAPYVALAVLAIGYLKASGAEHAIAQAFQGRELRMIVLAAVFGGLAPFCSCEVIPFIAGLLAVGTPLSAVMAFWLSSPLIDPPTVLITAAELGWSFALGKTITAVAIGLFGGGAIYLAQRLHWFGEPLRPRAGGCCGCSPSLDHGKPVWKFWRDAERRGVFKAEALGNALFLLKWLSLAYLLESLMLRYVPAEAIAGVVGGPGLLPIATSALVGAPAYLNGYAAPAIVSGLIDHGMTPGAGMAFIVAGAVTSIPAMTAVFALVRGSVFAAYLVLGFTGAVLSGIGYSAYLALTTIG